MSAATELTKLNTNMENAYTACDNKGATIPSNQCMDNLATCISSIPTGSSPSISSLSITPSTSQQTFTASGGTDGYSPVTVSAVTSSIDSNISAGNIKSGVSILGVSGSVTELKGEMRTVTLTSVNQTNYTPSVGKNGITSIYITPGNKSLSITPSTSLQTITVPRGYSGFGTLTVNAVTSSIDSNITAENIKKNVTILGVTGTYEGSGGGSDISYFRASSYDGSDFYDSDGWWYNVTNIILAQSSVSHSTTVATIWWDCEDGNYYSITPYITDFDSINGYIYGTCAVGGTDRIINFESDGLYVGDLVGISNELLNLGEFLEVSAF